VDFVSRAFFINIILLGGVKQVACSCYCELVATSVHSSTAIGYAKLILRIVIVADGHALS
jgi:hypothetical protein